AEQEALKKLQEDIMYVSRKQIDPVNPTFTGRRFPPGTKLFNIVGDGPPVEAAEFNETMERMQGSLVSSEGARRAIAILNPILDKQGMSYEDSKFLADQAGLALEGAELQVVIPPAATQTSSKKLRELQDAMSSIINGGIDLSNAINS